MRYEIEKPTCEKCGAEMRLAQIEPNEPGHDLRTFECPACDHAMIIKYLVDE